ncbi:MAG: hypothetical protein JWN98_11 [Abditibacteriota bacterium]|nr:hypothetical protein [Abditibacteriota bacterium]
MTGSKQVKCSICGRAIHTAFGSVLQKSVPLVCRHCFGEQSYGGKKGNKYSVVAPAEAVNG